MTTFDRETLERRAAELMEEQFARVPKMREFHAAQWTEREYYVRHLVETVLRIRLNNEVDAYALFRVGSKDDVLAANLARYLAEEYGHEHMFLRDLGRFGLDREAVDAIGVFPSTEQLMGFLRLAADTAGPAPTTVWDWFVEWYSDRYNGVITDHAAEVYGAEMVRGSKTHIAYDDSHDHDDLMFETVSRAVSTWSTSDRALRYLDTYVRLVGDYFAELYHATAGAAEKQALVGTAQG
jgi:hypothetical protein